MKKLVALVVLVVCLAIPAAGLAQSAGQAQYGSSHVCQTSSGQTYNAQTCGTLGGPAAATPGHQLPFTGDPVMSLVILAGGMLLIGLAIRFGPNIRN